MLVKPGMTALKRSRLSSSKTSGRTTSMKTSMASSVGPAWLSAAARSLAPIKVTSRPSSTGNTVSLSATSRQLSSMAANRPRAWRTKCQ